MTLRLMHVDDNPDDRMLVRHELEKVFPGLNVVEPTDEASFRAAVAAGGFDLVVTDYRIGWTDGLAVLAAVKAARPGCPVVMFTGTGSEEVAVEGMKAGLDDYVVKSPVHYLRLTFAVRSALERAEARREAARLTAALQEAEERSRLLVEGVPDYAIFMVTPEGRIGSWNPGAERLLGYAEAEIVGRPFSTLFTPEDARVGKPEDELREAAEQGRSARDGWRARKDGGRIWVSGVLSALQGDGDGGLRGYAKVMRDLTDRKRMEDTLREQKERLAEADRRKDEFLATLAHELRNPLAPIRMGLEVLRLSKDDPAATEEMLGTMERQVVQMVRLIDDLLDVSRITRGKLDLRKTRVELKDVLKTAVEAARPLIDEAGHRLTVTTPEQALVLDADSARLSQVFSNLLNNAAKYTTAAGRIDVAAAVEGADVAVSVRDTGIGIPAEMLETVFEMFTQVHQEFERSHGGLGIGLTLVKNLVEMHGGSVEAKSEGEGRGSEFLVRLPLAGTPGVEAGVNEDGGTSGTPVPRKVLVVDDNRDAADSLATVLRAIGHEVVTVYDGEAALVAAGAFRPDVAILDLGMPGVSGYDAARAIRRQPWGGAVLLVALTGWGQDEDRRRTQEAGFDRHLVKPVEPATLRDLLAEVEPVRA